MKIRFRFIKILLTLLCILPLSAKADLPVIDFSTLFQLIQQLKVLKDQSQYIQSELQQLKAGQYQWSNVQGVINNLGSIVSQTNGISYSASNINQRFQLAYPGYQPPQDYSQQYKNNATLTLNTLNGVLQSIGSSAQDFQNENTRLAFLQQQAQSAQGQTQAIQASAQIASEMVSQVQLLRQTVIAQTNAQTSYYATKIQNDASAKAELQSVIQSGSTNVPSYGTSGHSLNLPDM